MAEGIETRHERRCHSAEGRRCNCSASFRASVWSPRDGRLIRKTFPTKAAAKSWRHDALAALTKGELRTQTRQPLREAAEAWLADVRSGQIRNRSGDPYKPSAIRTYERNLRLRVLPALGTLRLSDIRRRDVQDLADKLHAGGASPSTIDSTLNPLRAIYRRAVARGEVGINPTRGLELPAIRGGRDRIASPGEARRLLAALPDEDRPIWATAMYAGLRRGELRALEASSVDLSLGLIHVERSWDDIEGPIGLKSEAGKRRVPIAGVLGGYLLASGGGEGLAFGATPHRPFEPGKLTERADDAWTAAKLNRITLHECRHTFASLMIAAGVNAKALSTYMGHANISITLDRYGHLMPGNEGEAAGLLDAYLSGVGPGTRATAVTG
jgi:integrase